jgi:hypothetical protein
MRPDDIRALLRHHPFRPFRLVLTNNVVYEIRHPELVAVTRSLVHLGLPASPLPGAHAERVVSVALLHIVQYELLTPAPAGNSD